MPKYDHSIVTLNPFSNLTSTQLNIYFYLKNVFEHMHEGNALSITNNDLSQIVRLHPRTVSVCLAALHKSGAISIEYIPDKNGTIRKIYWKGLPNE